MKGAVDRHRPTPYRPTPYPWDLPLKGLYAINEASNWPSRRAPRKAKRDASQGVLYQRALDNYTRSSQAYERYQEGMTPWHRALARHERKRLLARATAVRHMHDPSRLAPKVGRWRLKAAKKKSAGK